MNKFQVLFNFLISGGLSLFFVLQRIAQIQMEGETGRVMLPEIEGTHWCKLGGGWGEPYYFQRCSYIESLRINGLFEFIIFTTSIFILLLTFTFVINYLSKK